MNRYPNITWAQFDICNSDATKQFENMCRRIFTYEFLEPGDIPHINHNNKGIEVLPILEANRSDNSPRKKISFQSKYTNSPSSAYKLFKESALVTVENYEGDLDIVYLFCNKILTTDSKSYKQIEEIHEKAGIKTIPISNDELLDLVAKYKDIADYYFWARRIADTAILFNEDNSDIILDRITDNIVAIDNQSNLQIQNRELIKELVSEKIQSLRKSICNLEIDKTDAELNNLLKFNIDGLEGVDVLYYYKLLVSLYDGSDYKEYFSKCSNLNEAKWVISFYNSDNKISSEEFLVHDSIIQILVIDKLFKSQKWEIIIDLFFNTIEKVDADISEQFEFFYGLSLFNIKDYNNSSRILHNLYKIKNNRVYKFYAVCSDIRCQSVLFQNGKNIDRDKIVESLSILDSFSDLIQYKQQFLLVATIEMELYYYLGLFDSIDLQRVEDKYNSYPEDIRSVIIIQLYYALCMEVHGKYDSAASIYSLMDWKNNKDITVRYMLCYINNNNFEKAIEVYDNVLNKTSNTDAAYLYALIKSNNNIFEEVLEKLINKYKYSIIDLYNITYFIEDNEILNKRFIPYFKEILSDEEILNLTPHQVIDFLILFARSKDLDLLYKVLQLIDDFDDFNSVAIVEIYKLLFDVVNKECIKKETSFNPSNELEVVNSIAEIFIRHNIRKDKFLNIKILYTSAKHMMISVLKYSKELFDLTQDEHLARNIIGLLVDRNEKDYNKYAQYIKAIEDTEKPDYCIVLAFAMYLLERREEADNYAYKALYYLNETKDYEIFKSFINYCNYDMHILREDYELTKVKGGTVVGLTECESEIDIPELYICLDSEVDSAMTSNHSLGVEHISANDKEYIKLRGCGIGNIINLYGKRYKINKIISRIQYGYTYIYQIIKDEPDKFNGFIKVLSADDIDKMLDEIKKINIETDSYSKLLDSYHFIDNTVGLPIDSITSGNYEKYIIAFRYLLYKDNEALYAGESLYNYDFYSKYVPTLSTLVLLAELNRLDVIERIIDKIIIPQSYNSFFRERLSKSTNDDQLVYSNLGFDENGPIVTPRDKTISSTWEKIIDFCNKCKSYDISDEQRIDFNIYDGVAGESFISGFRLNQIHLDAYVLARKEEATLLCDDLFLRKIANWTGITNCNTATFIQGFDDKDYIMSFIMELSRLNYIYIPLISRDNNEAEELINNITSGEKKKLYYEDLLNRLYIARLKVLRELFGEEYVDDVEEVIDESAVNNEEIIDE